MIYFLCPFCKDDLEVDDGARGEHMECPNCGREIEVPEKGLDIQRVRQEAPKKPKEATPGARFLLVVVLAAAVLIGGGVAAAVFLFKPAPQVDDRPPCGSCAGSGQSRCSGCNGAKATICGRCKGTGFHKNVQDEAERCYECTGTGKRDCQVCAGNGSYSCKACEGTGKQGGKAPPLPEGTPENP